MENDSETPQGGANAAELRRRLQSRHIQMLALGGALGTGLFYGSGDAIAVAGPAVLVSYCIGGLFIYMVLRMLGEMTVHEPVAGSFSHFAHHYWGEFAGFLSGWNYWFMFVVVGIAELVVIGIYLDHWLPVAHWKTAFFMLTLITLANVTAVRFFGEFEFWFSCVKVLAVIGMIIFGLALIFSGKGGPSVQIANLWAYGGFFPFGLSGAVMALTVVMFAFGGSELIGMTAAEAHEPEISLPKAIRQFIARILVFYVGATAVILVLSPWNMVKNGEGSPFVTVFDAIGIPAAADILNLVVITAAVSVLNSGSYSNGRMLLSLARQKNAPQLFTRLNRFHAPYAGVLFSSFCSGFGLALHYCLPGGSFMRVLAIVTTAVATSWAMIVLVHLKFCRVHRRHTHSFQETTAEPRRALVFKAPFYPYSNYLCLLFLAGLFVLVLLSGFTAGGLLTRFFGLRQPLVTLPVPDISISGLIVPLWIALLYIGFRLKNRVGKHRAAR